MKRAFLILMVFLLISKVSGQGKMDSIREILRERKEVFLSLSTDGYKSGFLKSQFNGFDKIQNGKAFIYMGESDLDFISENLKQIEILPAPSMLHSIQMADTKEEVLSGEAYATYDLYLEIMQYFQENWPNICKIDSLGYTTENRLLLAARLEKNANSISQKPAFFYSSSMHGDETAGYSLMLMLINELLTRNEEPEINSILENIVIYINPLENPDGTFFTSDTTVFGSTRGNANGVNLNRNYPDPVMGPHSDGEEYQEETLAMMDYLEKIKPKMSANFHGGAEVVNYPFDALSDRHADDEWFRFVSLEYADTAKSIWPGYLNLYPSGITNGYDWYQVFGGRQDYVTYFLRGREVTIELSNTKTPQESLIFQLWSANKSSLINYIRQAGYGIHGYVTDSLTGEALEAEISIPGYDKLNSEVFSDPEKNGFFTRYLKEGVYNFIVQKDGYLQKNIFNVEVNDYMQTHLEIQLVPVPEEYEELNVRLSSDPYNSELILSIENPEAQTMLVRIYDLNGRLLFNRSYAIEEGFREIDLINDFGSNMIFIQLAFKNENRFFKVVKIK